jgi:hypothetical protein
VDSPINLTVTRGAQSLGLRLVDGSYPNTGALISGETQPYGGTANAPQPITVMVSGYLLADLCKALAGDARGTVTLTFDAANPLSPIRATGSAHPNAGELLMPVRPGTR